ncbi:hypothetical protein [Streptacidiphilus jiangxiensis]|uniref:Uncharacterized protein n=1 Tax=Streptacidiphilus jiangxiensis TaxID=235985 RepID=A0A1H7KU76_STRJI|nr:hypothetical protein [Streptacidiphilus jiangxiensis]SEK89497.1 hypothetical protein SAMN05414137_104174 [Streptacidiphilus jiangxiensis]
MSLFRKKDENKDDSGHEPLEKVIGYKGDKGKKKSEDKDDAAARKDKIKRISGGFGANAS